MRLVLIWSALILFAVPCLAADADPAIKHRIMFFEYGADAPNRLVELDADGKIVWEHKPLSLAVIFQPLADGHVLYGYGGSPTGAVEIDRDQKQVWNFVSKCPQVLGCQRLANGNTLVAEQGPPAAVEVDPKGKIVHTTPLVTSYEHFHQQVRNVQQLENGNVLAGHEGEGAAREVDPSGKVVWEYTGVANCPSAVRLASGNTLIACGTQKRLIEVDPAGKIAWEFGASDAPELNLTWVSSLQVLPNGNYLVGNFIRGAEGQGAHAFEVTRDKKVVWTFADHKQFKSITTVRALD
jgi:outer membrane protein assembly factor BamB